MLRAYYQTLKPERTYANVLTCMAGFLFACRWHINVGLFATTIIGTTLVVMSACAANNCTDRSIDARMPRTRKRALVTGVLPVRNVALLAIGLGLAGFGILISWTNWLVVLIGVLAYVDYVVLYAWSKRHSVHSTLIGTISGAAPLVAGYVAVTGRLDIIAGLLGLIMIFWQMPHFYAIGIFRHDDYKAANLPIWTVKKGVRSTQVWMCVYLGLYVLSLVALAIFSPSGRSAGIVIGLLGGYWLYLSLRGIQAPKPEMWARQMFGFSLVLMLVLSVALPLGTLLT